MARAIERHASASSEHTPARLDQVAARLFPEFSRARLQSWIRGGQLLVDGKSARPRDTVHAGAALTLRAELEEETGWAAQELPLTVVFEDEHLLVIDKPAGLVVHPGAGNASGTLVNALLHYRPALQELPRGGIVHRLDKDTSGLLVVAASPEAHNSLVKQLQNKSVRRQYLAVAQGRLTGGATVDVPIGRHPRQRQRMAVRESGGRDAVTHYRLAQRFGHFTSLDVHLETGRTHQIRVHLAHVGYALLGDPLYGGRLRIPAGASDRLQQALRAFGRQALHAEQLAFDHPMSGELREFSSPLPDDLEMLLAVLAEDDPFEMVTR